MKSSPIVFKVAPKVAKAVFTPNAMLFKIHRPNSHKNLKDPKPRVIGHFMPLLKANRGKIKVKWCCSPFIRHL